MNAFTKTTDFATTTSPLTAIAANASSLAMQLRGIDLRKRKEVAAALALPDTDIGRIITEFHQRLVELATEPVADLTQTDWLFLSMRAEGIASKCAREEWPRYAVNPHGLADMARLVADIQQAFRDLTSQHAPGAMGVAIDTIHFGKHAGVPSRAPTAPDADPASWHEALAMLTAAKAEYRRLDEAAHRATAAVEGEAPTPVALQLEWGGSYFHEEHITDSDLPADRKAELHLILKEWKPRRLAAEERHGLGAAHDAWDGFSGVDDAIQLVIDAPVPNLEALTEKVRVLLDAVHSERYDHDVDRAETVIEFLDDDSFDGSRPLTRIYQDLLRLTGQRPELANLQPPEPEDPTMWPAMQAALEEVSPACGALAREAREQGMTCSAFAQDVQVRWATPVPRGTGALVDPALYTPAHRIAAE